MNKVSLLAASVVLALTGCNDSNGDIHEGITPKPTPKPTPAGVVITAIDGYLQNAEVWIDTNDTSKLDNGDTKLSEKTDASGKFTLPAEYKGHSVFIKAIAGKTIDSSRGLISENFELATTSGSTVINPMTSMVVNLLATDSTLTQEEAEANVINSVTGSGLAASKELIFGDYIADDSKEAKALNVIGETLVDNAELPVEKQLELTDAVAVETKTVIDNDGDLTDFSPIVNTDGSVTPNSRPVVNTPLKPITLELGSAWTNIDAADNFSDAEDHTLTFSFSALKGQLNGLKIDPKTGIISGSPITAGDFNYQVFAEDVLGSLSYPLNLKVTIESPNTAPVVDAPAAKVLQADIDVWSLVEGEKPTASINIASLFTDADGDTLTYRADSTLTVDNGVETGFQVWIDKEGNISFNGLISRAAEGGVETLSVWAKDDINEAEAQHIFTLPQIEKATTPEPTPELGFTQAHFEKGGVWKMGSFDNGDAEVAYASMRIIDGVNQFCFATEDENNDNTLSSGLWKDGLTNLDKKEADIAASCQPAELNEDGTLSLVEGNESHTMTMVYQNVTDSTDYQIIIKMSDGELFWLDSSDTLFASFTNPEAKGNYIEYTLLDDANGYNKHYPILSTFTYTETSNTPDELIMREGTYDATSITENVTWNGEWSVIGLSPTSSEQYLALPEFNDDVNRDVIRRYFTYRNFGDINIGIGDSDKDNAIDYDGFFFITSDNEDIMTKITAAWTNK